MPGDPGPLCEPIQISKKTCLSVLTLPAWYRRLGRSAPGLGTEPSQRRWEKERRTRTWCVQGVKTVSASFYEEHDDFLKKRIFHKLVYTSTGIVKRANTPHTSVCWNPFGNLVKLPGFCSNPLAQSSFRKGRCHENYRNWEETTPRRSIDKSSHRSSTQPELSRST